MHAETVENDGNGVSKFFVFLFAVVDGVEKKVLGRAY
jgi:hypothetical protein